MSKIENSNQLRKEILRLQVELDKKEENLKAKFKEVRDDFKPENIAIRALSNVTGINFVKGDFSEKWDNGHNIHNRAPFDNQTGISSGEKNIFMG